ncbi:MAG: hypothetical protein KBS81_00620 [Spirochaetales bacterium]|nr:hypothetical protein [Candidatus Physcosoma equi]
MGNLWETLFSKIKGISVYGLVGRSGTGKSYHAKQVASRYNINLIIDDGLLIKGDRILAGHSAKQDPNFMAAVKTAVFDDEEHKNQITSALLKENYRKILIIGTSEKMVMKITQRLDLPEPSKIIHIEEVSSAEDIETAMHIRFTEGKHVIPVPSIEITRSAPQIVFDSIKVRLKKKPLKPTVSEKTIVKPEFSRPAKDALSETALAQMIKHAISEYDGVMKVKKAKGSRNIDNTYTISVTIQLPMRHYISTSITDLQQYIGDCLEKFGNIMVRSVSIEIEEWG